VLEDIKLKLKISEKEQARLGDKIKELLKEKRIDKIKLM
jgi:Mlc titration factor MtfA (ptsG expression regulator)